MSIRLQQSTIEPAGGQGPLTLLDAIKVFDQLANMQGIAHNYGYTNCHARSHLMCRVLQAAGYTPEKSWAFEEDEKKKLVFNKPQGKEYEWWYHTAPALPVLMPDGKVEMMIFDPALFNGPATMKEWADIMNTSEKNIKIAPFDVCPAGEPGNYTPNDNRPRFMKPGRAVDETTDENALARMDECLQIMRAYPEKFATRVVYSTTARNLAEEISPVPLPQEGQGWMSVRTYLERSQVSVQQLGQRSSDFSLPQGGPKQ